jgi:hypothetical protein
LQNHTLVDSLNGDHTGMTDGVQAVLYRVRE